MARHDASRTQQRDHLFGDSFRLLELIEQSLGFARKLLGLLTETLFLHLAAPEKVDVGVRRDEGPSRWIALRTNDDSSSGSRGTFHSSAQRDALQLRGRVRRRRDFLTAGRARDSCKRLLGSAFSIRSPDRSRSSRTSATSSPRRSLLRTPGTSSGDRSETTGWSTKVDPS
jgi:hypothetical protein